MKLLQLAGIASILSIPAIQAAPATLSTGEQVAAAAASAPALKFSKNSFEYMDAKYKLHTTLELLKRSKKDTCNIRTVHLRREW